MRTKFCAQAGLLFWSVANCCLAKPHIAWHARTSAASLNNSIRQLINANIAIDIQWRFHLGASEWSWDQHDWCRDVNVYATMTKRPILASDAPKRSAPLWPASDAFSNITTLLHARCCRARISSVFYEHIRPRAFYGRWERAGEDYQHVWQGAQLGISLLAPAAQRQHRSFKSKLERLLCALMWEGHRFCTKAGHIFTMLARMEGRWVA